MGRGKNSNPPKVVKSGQTKSTSNKVGKVSSANKIIGNKVRLKCKNFKQKEFANLIKEKEIVICSGPAGTGKSYVSIAIAIELLQNTSNSYNKILIIKPLVEADENVGFLPGDLKEKMAPFLASSIDIVDKIVGKSTRINLENSEDIGLEALGFIRGKTIDNAILIVEEAQNMSAKQMKTLLTRIGYNSKYIISGDLDQSDRYRNVEQSGLFDAMRKHTNIPEIGLFEFDINDIVRNPIITKILMNYQDENNEEEYPRKNN